VKTFIPSDERVSFELHPDIYIELSSDKGAPTNKDRGNDFLDFSTTYCHIRTYEHDISYIHEFIKMCETKFENSINEQLSKQKYIFKYNKSKSNNDGGSYDDDGNKIERGIKCQEYPLITNKHLLRNCFFTQRDALIKRIDFFINNEKWYNDRGIPYQLTLVFEGPPGCGKTSTMKGVATYSNRHIVDVDLSSIQTVCELENIFYGTHINGKYIPTNKRIFMIDEIDKFFELLDEKEEREKEKVRSSVNSETNSNIVIVKEGGGGGGGGDDKFKKSGTTTAISTCNQKKSNELTRGQVLSIMDGILESKGRFIICTANDTSKIDSTFKRPGRMDEIIHFSKCDSMMINQLMDLFYNGCVNEEDGGGGGYTQEKLDRFKGLENQLSPSELNKICFNNINSREDGEKQLLSLLSK